MKSVTVTDTEQAFNFIYMYTCSVMYKACCHSLIVCQSGELYRCMYVCKSLLKVIVPVVFTNKILKLQLNWGGELRLQG